MSKLIQEMMERTGMIVQKGRSTPGESGNLTKIPEISEECMKTENCSARQKLCYNSPKILPRNRIYARKAEKGQENGSTQSFHALRLFMELTMGSGYLEMGFNQKIAYFDVFFRNLYRTAADLPCGRAGSRWWSISSSCISLRRHRGF